MSHCSYLFSSTITFFELLRSKFTVLKKKKRVSSCKYINFYNDFRLCNSVCSYFSASFVPVGTSLFIYFFVLKLAIRKHPNVSSSQAHKDKGGNENNNNNKNDIWLTVMGVSSVALFLAAESNRTFLPRLSQSWYTISLIWLGSNWGSGQLNGKNNGQRKVGSHGSELTHTDTHLLHIWWFMGHIQETCTLVTTS